MKNENQLQIELAEEVADGTYANLAVIVHSSSEFVMDFIRMMPNVAKAKVKSYNNDTGTSKTPCNGIE